MIHWDFPIALWALGILPILAAVLLRGEWKRAVAARRFVDPAMFSRLFPPLSRFRALCKSVLVLGGLGALVIAAAGPRWGERTESVTSRSADFVILLDVSRSMLAEDVAPNRLERAKSDILDLLAEIPGDRVGLIVFAGTPVVKAPLSNDHRFFRTLLADVGPHSVPLGGSQIGDAIRKALTILPPRVDRDQVLVLISDGEDQQSLPHEAAALAADRQVKILAIGMGDVETGAPIPQRDSSGNLTYVRYQGREIWSRLEESLLEEIALRTGGAYIPARTRAYDLGQVYVDHLAGLARGATQTDKHQRYAHRFQWFIGLGIVLLLVETLLPRHFSVRRRPRFQSRTES